MGQNPKTSMKLVPKFIRDSKIISQKELFLLTQVPGIPQRNIDVQIEALYLYEQLGLKSLENFIKYLIQNGNIEWAWQIMFVMEDR